MTAHLMEYIKVGFSDEVVQARVSVANGRSATSLLAVHPEVGAVARSRTPQLAHPALSQGSLRLPWTPAQLSAFFLRIRPVVDGLVTDRRRKVSLRA